jgi:hypothetical protein
MNTTLRWIISAGLALASGLTGLGNSAAATSSETSPAITIHMRNYARVAPKTLAEAEEVATGIFREAGIDARWTEADVTAVNDQENLAGHVTYSLADIQLSILPREMSDRLGLSNKVMGVVPGTDAQIAYVFDGKVGTLSQEVLRAYMTGRIDRRVSESQILGHAIAHELAHLLLNLQGHSANGIMRGEWSLTDMRNAADGMLLFTPQQAEVLRADARRRNTQQETFTVAKLESRAPTR